MLSRIEMLGVTGTGKTTLAKELLKDKYLRGKIIGFEQKYQLSIKTIMKKKGLLKYFHFILNNKLMNGTFYPSDVHKNIIYDLIVENDYIYTMILNILNSNIDKKRHRFIIDLLLKDYYKMKTIEMSKLKKMYLMDEGIVQRAMAIYLNSPLEKNKDSIELFFRKFKLPSVLIYIENAIDQSIERIIKRESGIPISLRMYSISELREYIKKMKYKCEQLCDYMERNNVKVLRIENLDFNKSHSYLTLKLRGIVRNKKKS